MTPCTWHTLHALLPITPHSEAEQGSFGAFTSDRQTDIANMGDNNLHITHSMQPKNYIVDQYRQY